MTAMISPRRKARTIDTTESWIVTLVPDTSQSKYFPESTIAQSNLYFSMRDQTENAICPP